MGGAAMIMAAGLAVMAPANATAPMTAPASKPSTRPDTHMIGMPPRMVVGSRPMQTGIDATAISTTMGRTSHAIMMPSQDMPRAVPAK